MYSYLYFWRSSLLVTNFSLLDFISINRRCMLSILDSIFLACPLETFSLICIYLAVGTESELIPIILPARCNVDFALSF